MQRILSIKTVYREGLYKITRLVQDIVEKSGVEEGIVSVYAHGATAAIMIQEGWDDSVQNDVINLFSQLVPSGVWEHDRQDNNGDSHLKAGIIGPGETIPVIGSKLGLSTWQDIFLCEFDGPRQQRDVVVTILRTGPA